MPEAPAHPDMSVILEQSVLTEETLTSALKTNLSAGKPQPLYNTIVGVLGNFRVSCPIRVIARIKYRYIEN